jgi:hypothetical protein
MKKTRIVDENSCSCGPSSKCSLSRHCACKQANRECNSLCFCKKNCVNKHIDVNQFTDQNNIIGFQKNSNDPIGLNNPYCRNTQLPQQNILLSSNLYF